MGGQSPALGDCLSSGSRSGEIGYSLDRRDPVNRLDGDLHQPFTCEQAFLDISKKTSKTSFNKGLALGKKGLGKIALVSFIHEEVKKIQI